MVTDILTDAGITHNPVRFLRPPEGTYAVYFDAQEHRGSDNANFIIDHEVTIELYSARPDLNAQVSIEIELNKRGIEFSKPDVIWLDTEKLFQVIYTFDYTEKRSD